MYISAGIVNVILGAAVFLLGFGFLVAINKQRWAAIYYHVAGSLVCWGAGFLLGLSQPMELWRWTHYAMFCGACFFAPSWLGLMVGSFIRWREAGK